MTQSVLSVKLTRSGREARLLESAARLFARYGFDKTSVDDIAHDAGVSKGAVYLHWPSKTALFDAALVYEGLRMLDDILHRIESDPHGGALASIYRHSLVAMGCHPLILAVFAFDVRVLGDYVRRQDASILARRMLFGEEFVRRMQAANLMRRDLDPTTTAYVMGIISFGLFSMRELAPTMPMPSLEALADAVADLVAHGLATNDKHAARAGRQAFREMADETRRLYEERAS